MNRILKRLNLNRSAAAGLCVLALAGCGDTKLPTLDDAKKAVTSTVESSVDKVKSDVASSVSNVGKFELVLGEPVSAKGCFARIITFSDGRPAVLQITSYQEPSGEDFPSVFVRAELASAAPDALAGKIVQARVYVQLKPNREVWHSTPEAPVEIIISATDGTKIVGNIVQGTLVSSGGEAGVPLTGTFEGFIRKN